MLNACTPATNPGARALYLGGAVPKRVTCTEQALVVTNAGAQTWRYPLARVARVVSSPAVDWSGAALSLCMRAGITIAWIDSQGTSLGVCNPCRGNRSDVATALELLIAAPGGGDRYDNWLRHRRMVCWRQWAADARGAWTRQAREAIKRQWVYGGQCPARLPRMLRGLCLALVAGQLQPHRIPPRLWDDQARSVEIDRDLCQLLWAELHHGKASLTPCPDRGDAGAEAALIARFEGDARLLGASLLGHLLALQRLALKGLYE